MNIVFLGCTNYSKRILEDIIVIPNINIKAIFTIPQRFNISYSETDVHNTNYADLSIIAKTLGVPCYEVNSTDGKRITDYSKIIEDFKLDVILVMGWYYMVPSKIRSLAKYGAWGIHASLLPKYAGGAPLVWAIIEGEKISGVTLFQLSDGVDDGDILAQSSFSINDTDTINDVYEKAIVESRKILQKCLTGVSEITPYAQDKSKIQIYPQRSPKDGKIDWSWDSVKIKNFIRAQTKPYPGAWTVINNKKIIIWSADIIEIKENESDKV